MKALLIFGASMLLAAGLLLASPSATADTQYISDQLTVPLRSGPSNAHRILHRGLPSGTPLEVLEIDEDAGYTRVRLQNGNEGWLSSQYLVSQPIARDRLAGANRRIESLQAELTNLRQAHSDVQSAYETAEDEAAQLQARVNALEAELADIRRVSAGAIEQDEENRRLRRLNEQLQSEVADLAEELRQSRTNQQQRWMLTGAGLTFGGLLLGAWLRRPKRSGWG